MFADGDDRNRSGGLEPEPSSLGKEKSVTLEVSDNPVVEYIWPDEVWGREEVEIITGISRRVPYVGRASSPAIVSVDRCPAPDQRVESSALSRSVRGGLH